MIKGIIDLTDFVKQQKQIINERKIDELKVAEESVYYVKSDDIKKQISLIDITKYNIREYPVSY